MVDIRVYDHFQGVKEVTENGTPLKDLSGLREAVAQYNTAVAKIPNAEAIQIKGIDPVTVFGQPADPYRKVFRESYEGTEAPVLTLKTKKKGLLESDECVAFPIHSGPIAELTTAVGKAAEFAQGHAIAMQMSGNSVPNATRIADIEKRLVGQLEALPTGKKAGCNSQIAFPR